MRTQMASWGIMIGWVALVCLLSNVAQGQTSDEQLAEKFKPILVLDSRDNDQSPKEVNIDAVVKSPRSSK